MHKKIKFKGMKGGEKKPNMDSGMEKTEEGMVNSNIMGTAKPMPMGGGKKKMKFKPKGY